MPDLPACPIGVSLKWRLWRHKFEKNEKSGITLLSFTKTKIWGQKSTSGRKSYSERYNDPCLQSCIKRKSEKKCHWKRCINFSNSAINFSNAVENWFIITSNWTSGSILARHHAYYNIYVTSRKRYGHVNVVRTRLTYDRAIVRRYVWSNVWSKFQFFQSDWHLFAVYEV